MIPAYLKLIDNSRCIEHSRYIEFGRWEDLVMGDPPVVIVEAGLLVLSVAGSIRPGPLLSVW
jgi:hypothetical protein